MITKTNYQLYKELIRYDFYPKRFGVIDEREVKTITTFLQIDERDELSLRNLRDFVVAITDNDHTNKNLIKDLDRMSAICGVIDNRLYSLGCEI